MATSPMSNASDLDRLAEEELLRESERARVRSEIIGIEGFKKCPLLRTNKRFLVNTIVNNIKSNNIANSQHYKKRNRNFLKAPHTRCEKTSSLKSTDSKYIISADKETSKK